MYECDSMECWPVYYPDPDEKVINSSTKCLISVKIAILTPHIIPPPLVNVWLIFDLQKYVNWLCVFLKVNPRFQSTRLLYGSTASSADPYNVVCSCSILSLYNRFYWTPATSSKQPVKDNEVVVSDWLPLSRMWHEKVSSGTFTCNEPI